MRRLVTAWLVCAVPLLMAADDRAHLDDLLETAEDLIDEANGNPPVAETSPMAVPAAASPQPTPRASPRPKPPQHPGILQLDTREWKISAGLRDHYAGDFKRLQSLASPRVHHNDSGGIDGYELHLRRYGLAHQAGFRSGDVVHAVNGHALRSLPTLLSVYRQLRRENELRVDLTRKNGNRLRLRYHIR